MAGRFDVEPFDREIGRLQNRLDELIGRSDLDGDTRALAAEALTELGVVIEELQSQNAELQAGRADLEAERERYRELFDVMPDGYAVTDRNGVVSEANATLCALLECSHAQLLGRPLSIFIAEEHRRTFYAELARLNEVGVGGHLTVNLTVRDGVLVPMVLRAAFGAGDEAPVIRWLFHDRRDELRRDQLRASEERLRALLDSAAVGVVLCDPGGEPVYANKYAERLLRGRGDGDRPRTWLEATHLDDLTMVSRMLRAAYEEGRAGVLRHRLEDRDGAPCWVEHSVVPFIDPDGRVDGFVSTLIEVTAEHLATLALQESREFTDAVINNVGALVLVLDPDLTVRRVNRPVAELTGYREADMIGRNALHTFVPADQRDAVAVALAELLSQRSNTFENDWLMADGRRRQLTWTNTTLTDADGSVRAIVATGIDVTEQRQFEAQLAQADRLSAVGRLAAGLAHDVNNTLTVLGLRMERLRDRHLDTPASIGDLDAMQRSMAHTQALIADLQTFGSRHELRPAALNVNTATTRMLGLLDELLGSQIEVVLSLTEEDTTTSIDPVRFDQALTNLAINARDAMADGGRLHIVTALDEVTATARPTGAPPTLEPGRYVRLAVSDTGAGIARDALAHVFDPYFTTKAPTRGTGLGLAVTYGTITRAGGAIIVDSALGEGATFTIWLPHVPVTTASV